MPEIEMTYCSPNELKPRLRAFRTHSEEQIERLCASINTYGAIQPAIIDNDNRIVCGTAFVEAAKRLRLNRIPVIRVEHLTEAELRSYAIAANKLADMAGYDDEQLALEIADIQELLGDCELHELGIETVELDRLLDPCDEGANAETEVEPDPAIVISLLGDLWSMGDHRQLVGNALDGASYAALMPGELAQAVLCDLPYNRATSDFSTTGRFGDFQQGAGEMTPPEFVRFLTTSMRHMCEVSEDGSLHLFFMSFHFLLELLRAGTIVYDGLKAVITWDKGVPGLGSLWRHQSEFIVALKHGKAPHRTNANKRNRSTVWQADGLSIFSPDRAELLAGHPSTKPLVLIREAVLDISDRGGIVLDPFSGSGTLAIACEQIGRRARMIEIDPIYADVALRRFRKATGVEPILMRTGQTFAECEAQASSALGPRKDDDG